MAKNYYGVLGLARSASDEEIRRRFKHLARERHPDRFRGDEKVRAEKEFQAITEAFNVLTDPERRRVHDLDLARSAGPARSGAGGGEDRSQLVKSYLAQGVKAYKAKDYAGAAQSFERAAEVDPKNPQAWFNLAMTRSRQPRGLTRAVEAAERACELEPMKPSYLKLAGRLYAQAGQSAKARRFLEKALAWGEDDPEVQAVLDELRGGGKGRRGLFGRTS